jgi:hypothetical protein
MLGTPSAISPSLAEPPGPASSNGGRFVAETVDSPIGRLTFTLPDHGLWRLYRPRSSAARAVLGQRDENSRGFDANTSYAMRAGSKPGLGGLGGIYRTSDPSPLTIASLVRRVSIKPHYHITQRPGSIEALCQGSYSL